MAAAQLFLCNRVYTFDSSPGSPMHRNVASKKTSIGHSRLRLGGMVLRDSRRKGNMKTYQRILGGLVVLAMVSSSAVMVLAQDQYPAQGQVQDQAPPAPDGQQQGSPENDPPSRAARLQFMDGSVSVQPHGTEDWVAGAINRPLTNSDNVWADKNSRAEINVGSGLIRIDSESSLTLTNLSENAVQLQLHQGAMNLHLRRLDDGETYEVDTPNQAFTVLKPGDYRFDVNPDADTTVVTVWQGEGESSGKGPAVRIRDNEQARFSNGDSMTNQIHAAPATDAFDQWAQSRDHRHDNSASARYVSPDVVGSEDLDEYGSWRDSPDYGNVWVPSHVDAGWAPYRDGHWIWVAPWGWTWVDDEPWGYAPFHYGRWVYYDNYWGWAPGPIYVRPYYAPALVAWFGGGGGWGVGVGFGGGYGWCPLGFGEPFIPWYGVSRGYFNRVNVNITNVNITNVYNNNYINRGGLHGGEPLHYANLHERNGFTAVSRDTLVNSRPVARNNLRVSPNELSRVSPVRSLDVKPTRTTMLGANAGRTAAMPPPRSFSRPVVSRENQGSFRGGQAPGNRGGDQSAMSNVRGTGQRPVENLPNRGAGPNNGGSSQSAGPQSNVRMPDRGADSPRYVPRPPSAGGMTPDGRNNQGGFNRGNSNQNNQNADRGNARPVYSPGGNNPRSDVYRQPGTSSYPQNNSRPAPAPSMRPSPSYTPRSTEGPSPRGNTSAPQSNVRSGGPRSEVSVPRPNGNVAPSGYSSAGERGNYSRPNNNRPNYGGGGSYSRPAPAPAPSYDRGYSRSAPSYGGGSYSRPSPAPAPSYDRGYSRPSPSYSGGSYGGSAPARSAPAYSGGGNGGGGRPSGGNSGGGRSAPAPSRSSGSGGGSRDNGGNPHGRH